MVKKNLLQLFYFFSDSTGLLWVRPYISNSVQHVLFVFQEWFVKWKVSDQIDTALWSAIYKYLFQTVVSILV